MRPKPSLSARDLKLKPSSSAKDLKPKLRHSARELKMKKPLQLKLNVYDSKTRKLKGTEWQRMKKD